MYCKRYMHTTFVLHHIIAEKISIEKKHKIFVYADKFPLVSYPFCRLYIRTYMGEVGGGGYGSIRYKDRLPSPYFSPL